MGWHPFFFHITHIPLQITFFIYIFSSLLPMIRSHPLNKCHIRVYNGRLRYRVVYVSLLIIYYIFLTVFFFKDKRYFN